MENLIKMDDLGVPLFLETPIFYQLAGRKQLPIKHIQGRPMKKIPRRSINQST